MKLTQTPFQESAPLSKEAEGWFTLLAFISTIGLTQYAAGKGNWEKLPAALMAGITAFGIYSLTK